MAELENTSAAGRRCAQCGTELPPGVPAALCPRCLLKAGLGPLPAVGPGGTLSLAGTEAASRGLPQPGEQLGHYLIVRLLGAGGMGAVYEAEDLENGRRVALKVLSHKLDSPEARERFFREGRLAASINHPNSVYVFGTEEIAGTPVIAMELVSGGTLQDRVREKGPLPICDAVDAVLQMIDGLAAAQRIGILHRDIKPSNCYVAEDGTVKIGDFGLSISTAIRTEPALTATGAFLGTPAFCSPEQLRGEELNARSDMYAVGATLYYLLTGRTPFEGKNMVALLATVLEQRPPSPRKLRPNIPQGLSKTILRCLEKQPGERFKSYDELAQALVPYSSAAPTPATLGLRFLAGALDMFVLSVGSMAIFFEVFGSPFDFLALASQGSAKLLGYQVTCFFVIVVFYYGLPEGLWGASVGKALFRLRVVRADKRPPGPWRASFRAVIYVVLPGLPYLPFLLVYGSNPKRYLDASPLTQTLLMWSGYLALALLFSTARWRNGFAAVHDLATDTRVVSRLALESRPALLAEEPPPPAVDSVGTVGPYHVLETLEESAGTRWLLGYDLRLLRKVWICTVPPGTPPVPAVWRGLGRVGRLRWLTGKRGPEQNWDAFEGLTGQPLLHLMPGPQPWGQVRHWLSDLATEISAAQKDGTLPELALDRVWITGEGRAKLLDFSVPGLRPAINSQLSPLNSPATPPLAPGNPPPIQTCNQFLAAVATAALVGSRAGVATPAGDVPVRLPLHAREFLKKLPQLFDAEAVLVALRPMLGRVAAVSRLRRAVLVAACLLLPLVGGIAAFFVPTMFQFIDRQSPGLRELQQVLNMRATLRLPFFPKNARMPTDRQFAVYIASHCRGVITNEASWSNTLAVVLITGEARRFAEQSVAEYPAPAQEEIAAADEALKPFQTYPANLNLPRPYIAWIGVTGLLAYVCIAGLIAALAFRGGLLLLMTGVTFVRRDGVRASRLRVFWRALVTWSVLPLGLLAFGVLAIGLGPSGASLCVSVLVCALVIVSLALPERGLQDRLAGTWPVPR